MSSVKTVREELVQISGREEWNQKDYWNFFLVSIMQAIDVNTIAAVSEQKITSTVDGLFLILRMMLSRIKIGLTLQRRIVLTRILWNEQRNTGDVREMNGFSMVAG